MNHILWMTLLEFFFMRDYYYYRQKLYTHYQHKSNSNACCCFSICVNDWGKKSVTVFLEEGGRGGSLCNVKGGHRNTIKYWPVMVCYDLKKIPSCNGNSFTSKAYNPGLSFCEGLFCRFCCYGWFNDLPIMMQKILYIYIFSFILWTIL